MPVFKEELGEGGSAGVPVHATSLGKIIISVGPVGWREISSLMSHSRDVNHAESVT